MHSSRHIKPPTHKLTAAIACLRWHLKTSTAAQPECLFSAGSKSKLDSKTLDLGEYANQPLVINRPAATKALKSEPVKVRQRKILEKGLNLLPSYAGSGVSPQKNYSQEAQQLSLRCVNGDFSFLWGSQKFDPHRIIIYKKLQANSFNVVQALM